MISKAGFESHRPPMQDSFVTQGRKRAMTMNNIYALSYNNIPEYWKESIDGWKSG